MQHYHHIPTFETKNKNKIGLNKSTPSKKKPKIIIKKNNKLHTNVLNKF